MYILVLSDSHASMHFMRRCIEATRPDAIVHLGDYFDDGLELKEEYPNLPLYQVPGNCDSYRCPPGQPEILTARVCGVKLYMTHGHRHRVKLCLDSLLRDARANHAQGVLFGHTHQALCRREEDGLWVLNPGASGYFGGSAGWIETEGEQIRSCRILGEADLTPG